MDDLEPLLEAFMLDDLLYQNKIEEFKKIKNELKYVNKIWEEYNDNINSINHYTKPANMGNGHDIIRPILWDYIIQMAIVNPETHNIIQFSRGKDELYESQFSQNAYFRSIKNFIDNSENNSNSIIVNLVSSLKIRKNRKECKAADAESSDSRRPLLFVPAQMVKAACGTLGLAEIRPDRNGGHDEMENKT